MGVFSLKTLGASPAIDAIQVTCGACNGSAWVSTRQQFATFEEAHLSGCGSSWVSVDPPFADLLDLPPY